jgi:hypothetical protein
MSKYSEKSDWLIIKLKNVPMGTLSEICYYTNSVLLRRDQPIFSF